VEEGRWHASWDEFAVAAEHSIICGGVALSAAARSVPMSIVDGSTSPSQELELDVEVEVVHAGHGSGGGGQDVAEAEVEAMAEFCAVTTGGRFETGLDLIPVPVDPVDPVTASLGSAGRGAEAPGPLVLERTKTMARRTQNPTHMGIRSFTMRSDSSSSAAC